MHPPVCRKCGEPDKRGSARNRRRSKQRLLDEFGDGKTCPCAWCGTELTFFTLERDRLEMKGPYAFWNLVPSCSDCNRRRTYERLELREGCYFG